MKLKALSSETIKTITLAAMSALVSVVFSVMGAPFVRVLATTKSKVFWLVGLVLISTLFFTKLNLLAIYVGAIWMTLGLYSELEKTGLNWRKSSTIAVAAGVLFGALSSLIISKWSLDHALVKQATEPLMQSLKQVLPDETFETKAVLLLMPGLLAAALISALAASLVFESQIFQAFKIRREKLASGLRWLEFKLPDFFIWMSLISLLFSIVETPYKLLQITAVNLSVISIVAYFFQGISILEFATRVFRFGKVTKLLMYLLIVTSALPVVVVLGFADYWVDFRKHMRKRIKV